MGQVCIISVYYFQQRVFCVSVNVSLRGFVCRCFWVSLGVSQCVSLCVGVSCAHVCLFEYVSVWVSVFVGASVGGWMDW